MIYHKQRMFELVVDFFVISGSYIAAYLLRYEGVLSPASLDLILDSLPIIIIIKLSTFYWFGLYKGVWQYIGLHDLFDVIKAVTFGCVASILALVFIFRIEGYSRAVFITDWLILLISASGVRMAMRMFREYFNFDSAGGNRIFIMGAGDAGEYFLRGLRYNKRLNFVPAGFLDDDREKKGRKIHGIPILGTRYDIPELIKKYSVNEIIIAIPSLEESMMEEIMKLCKDAGVACRKMTDITLW
jgi:UDP-GlcNAc:undecaprenyl-phosphate GlcNAc-1-phosphate transferase